MKVLKGLITFVLILVIVGGVGFLGWNLIYKSGMSNMGNMSNMPNMTGNTNNDDTNSSSQMDNMQNNNFFTTQAVQNKDKLNQITTTINDAINQITIDPYSKVTLPSSTQQPMMQPTQGNTTVNIYPNGNAAAGSPTSPQMTTKGNYVYNQDKLEQLHNGIFKLAQGRMILDDLNNDLTMQSTMSEPTDYQGYSVLYNAILQNKIKLNNALTMINEASSLLNVNPYSSGTAYEYNTEEMKNLHNGIYKLAQGLLSGTKLNEEFTNQMVNISTLANNANSMGNMNMGQGFTLGTLNLSFIFKIILVIMIITLFIALFGAISSVFKRKVRE